MACDQRRFSYAFYTAVLAMGFSFSVPEPAKAQGHGGGGWSSVHGKKVSRDLNWGFGTSSHSDDSADQYWKENPKPFSLDGFTKPDGSPLFEFKNPLIGSGKSGLLEGASGEGGRLPPDLASQLDVDAARERLESLPDKGEGMCAKGVRLTLNELFPKDMGNGPNAHEWTLETVNRWAPPEFCEIDPEVAARNPQDFDVRILQSAAGSSNPFGHAELFFEGKHYSDFDQGEHSLGVSPVNYNRSATRVFRICGGSQAAVNSIIFPWVTEFIASSNISLNISSNIVAKIKQWVFPSAHADIISPDTKTYPRRHKVVAELKDEQYRWLLVEVSKNQGLSWELQRLGPDKNLQLVAEEQISPFFLLEKMNRFEEIPAERIGRIMMDQWIKEKGYKFVQNQVDTTPAQLTALQIKLYKYAGIKLPKKYKMLSLRVSDN